MSCFVDSHRSRDEIYHKGYCRVQVHFRALPIFHAQKGESGVANGSFVSGRARAIFHLEIPLARLISWHFRGGVG